MNLKRQKLRCNYKLFFFKLILSLNFGNYPQLLSTSVCYLGQTTSSCFPGPPQPVRAPPKVSPRPLSFSSNKCKIY